MPKIPLRKKRYQQYILCGSDSPISSTAAKPHEQYFPTSSSDYGIFPEHILFWIDNQETPPWSNFESQEDFERHSAEIFHALKYLTPKRVPESAKLKRKEKTKIIKLRRTEFNGKREQYMLTMLELEIPYICSDPACTIIENLTIDHIIPLSRGGSDDLENFQFLCMKHNQIKGAKMQTAVS